MLLVPRLRFSRDAERAERRSRRRGGAGRSSEAMAPELRRRPRPARHARHAAALERAPAACCGRGWSARPPSPRRCCWPRWSWRSLSTPDPTGVLLAGLNARGHARRRRHACCSATRSCSRCTRWRAWRASSRAARCRWRPSATTALAQGPRQGRPAGDRLRDRRDDVLAPHPGLRPRHARRDARRPAGHLARRCCSSALLPHALPELIGAVPAAGRLDGRQPPRRLGRAARRDVRDRRVRDPAAGRRRVRRGLRLAAPDPRAARLSRPARAARASPTSVRVRRVAVVGLERDVDEP